MSIENNPTKPQENKPSEDLANKETNQDKWCFSWMSTAPEIEPGAERAALIKSTKWDAGTIITVSFLDGDPEVQEKIKAVAQEWVAPGMANLILSFRNDTNQTDIRISFQFAGSWSVLGTTCRNITDLNEATMNYGWLTNTSTDEEIKRVVLHEFGHALGLTHEHMNPGGHINWNREQVIADLSGPPNNWSLETIENNMFRTFDAHETNFTELDAASIMMYPIPEKWTNDGFSVGLNTELSDVDKEFIRSQYP